MYIMKRDLKKFYNPITGKRELKHWASSKPSLPSLNLGSVSKVESVVQGGTLALDIVEKVDVGKTIIDNLRKRSKFGAGYETKDLYDIRSRIDKLVMGKGLQVN